jgi:hypothetical protein
MSRGEDYVQSVVRLHAPTIGETLWRNNVGVLIDATGRPVRFGLANDSPKLNAALKSGDLIGWRTVTITPEMVGARIAQFISRECKHEGWEYTGRDREAAQAAWLRMINAAGGDARFMTGIDGGVNHV